MRGVATEVRPDNGNRIVCMCDDCQAFALFLERPDALDQYGGTDIYQTTPAQLAITDGIEHLRAMRLSEKGLIRWYAGCCNTPVANTADTARAPFAGVIHTFMDHDASGRTRDDVLGPPIGLVMAKFALGQPPAGAHQTITPSIVIRSMVYLLKGLFNGKASPSPFFDARTKAPVVAPKVLTKAERDAIRERYVTVRAAAALG
jgi:Family of unknown function (DUF6151)